MYKEIKMLCCMSFVRGLASEMCLPWTPQHSTTKKRMPLPLRDVHSLHRIKQMFEIWFSPASCHTYFLFIKGGIFCYVFLYSFSFFFCSLSPVLETTLTWFLQNIISLKTLGGSVAVCLLCPESRYEFTLCKSESLKKEKTSQPISCPEFHYC